LTPDSYGILDALKKGPNFARGVVEVEARTNGSRDSETPHEQMLLIPFLEEVFLANLLRYHPSEFLPGNPGGKEA
jgi:hypothetical protein